MQEILIVGLYSYLAGSIPFGLILAKIFLKQDIRQSGSGNIGATNVLRTGGKLLGLLTLILDGLKGYIAVLVTMKYYQDYIFLSALLSFLGHLFPIWLKFKGGKGVATYLGILFAFNILLPLVFIVSWLVIVFISKFASLASLVSTFIVLIVNIFLEGLDQSVILFLFFVLIMYSHKTNIGRLKAGTENKINL
jgi:glycerol-3-phosphate acyltransferase PlsY